MLHPRFFARPADLTLESWQTFEVLGYSQVEDWTLVQWRIPYGFADSGRYLQHETLYQGMEEIDNSLLGGAVDLYSEPEIQVQSATPQRAESVWDRVDSRLGNHGMPSAVAIALRAPENYVCFQI